MVAHLGADPNRSQNPPLILQKRPPKGPSCLSPTPAEFEFFLPPDSRSKLANSSLTALTRVLQQNLCIDATSLGPYESQSAEFREPFVHGREVHVQLLTE